MLADQLRPVLVRPDHGDGSLELELENEHELVLTIRNKRYPDPDGVIDEDDEDWPPDPRPRVMSAGAFLPDDEERPMIGNWNTEAATMADYVGDNMFEAHRGAMTWKQEGVSVVFGNDGYTQDGRARSEVAMVREHLGAGGHPHPRVRRGLRGWVLLGHAGQDGRHRDAQPTGLVVLGAQGPAREVMARPGDGRVSSPTSHLRQSRSRVPRRGLNSIDQPSRPGRV